MASELARRGWASVIGAIAGSLVLCLTAAKAEDSARAIAAFDHTSHDFGVVPRGAKLEDRFVVKNVYDAEMEIQSVSSSCGCSVAKLSRQRLKKLEQAEIVVTIDTRGSLGRKDATIKVALARPVAAEVQLHLQAYIRSDMAIQPEAVQFGIIAQGTATEQILTISYAGRKDWQIRRVECANPHITASATETGRTPSGASYKIVARLAKDAPPGYVREQLVLVTNDPDPKASRVLITVDGSVAAALSVSPLWMGVAEPGKPVTQNLLIQGREPFHIVAIRPSDGRFQCRAPTESKNRHIVPVTFLIADSDVAAHNVAAKIRIETDMPGAQPLEAPVSVQIAIRPAKDRNER